jgi:poly(hydroxyalkanoate) granule-associated protein
MHAIKKRQRGQRKIIALATGKPDLAHNAHPNTPLALDFGDREQRHEAAMSRQTPHTTAEPLPLQESASQIWLAGLGAFAKAQEEGTKVFDALVREGAAIQRRTQKATEEKISEAAQRMTHMAGEISSRATGQWGKLEMLFEDRVNEMLQQLGVITAAEIAELVRRIDQLEREVSQLPGGRSTRRAAPRKKT